VDDAKGIDLPRPVTEARIARQRNLGTAFALNRRSRISRSPLVQSGLPFTTIIIMHITGSEIKSSSFCHFDYGLAVEQSNPGATRLAFDSTQDVATPFRCMA
jgi:hypothetical protein